MHGRFVDDLVRARSAIESACVVRWEGYGAEATATAKQSPSKGEGAALFGVLPRGR